MTTLLEMVHSLTASLEEAGIPHAFGGALALAFCIGEPRATADIDINIFTHRDRLSEVLAALPLGVQCKDDDRVQLERDGQARLWWERTPIDVFLSTTDFHDQAAARTQLRDLAGRKLPFLSCDDLAVFKTFFNRPKDWVDLESMLLVASFDLDRSLGVLARYLGPNDERIAKLIALNQSLP
jgi:hypothetical protein